MKALGILLAGAALVAWVVMFAFFYAACFTTGHTSDTYFYAGMVTIFPAVALSGAAAALISGATS